MDLHNNVYKFCITGGSGFIGTNLIRYIKEKNNKTCILNIDKLPPKQNKLKKYWFKADINNFNSYNNALKEFKPDFLIHLAADATMNGKSLEDYKTNTLGVENLVKSFSNLGKDTRIIITSSQHVRKPGTYIYKNIDNYNPLGLYGESKVITEQIILNANLKQIYFIIRPTLVWGPYNYSMANTIFSYIKNNIYFHPSNDNTVRAYGYVDNLCDQILGLCFLDKNIEDFKILYLADHNLLQQEWINSASYHLLRSPIKTIPKLVLKSGSLIGDYIKYIYPKFPLYTERYQNLTTSNPVPLELSLSLLGKPKINLNDAMKRTTSWLNSYYR